MSANATVTARSVALRDKERSHRLRLMFGYAMMITLIAGLFIYGFDYYTLSAVERPFSPKHALLKPSGKIGVPLGLLGLCMFLAIFLYPLRKRWKWLSQPGELQTLAGYPCSAGVISAVHDRFAFIVQIQGFAGMAFWIMVAVSHERRHWDDTCMRRFPGT